MVEAPVWSLFYFVEDAMASEATVGEVEFLAAVDLLRKLDPEEREPVICCAVEGNGASQA